MRITLLGTGPPIPDAQRAGIGTLLLTHYVPAMQPGDEDHGRGLAADHFDGRIVLGDDLTSVEL